MKCICMPECIYTHDAMHALSEKKIFPTIVH